MSIRVTCNGCHTRFNVSDRFAGKEGPCPKCKKTIRIPDKTEEVVVHAPENFGPTDSQGRAVLKPIFREEAKVSAVQVMVIVMSIVLGLALAVVLRFSYGDGTEFPLAVLIGGAVLLAPPLSWAGYSFLHNRDLEAYRGIELWIRIAAVSGLLALLWALYPVVAYAMNLRDVTTVISGVVVVLMLLAGGVISMLAFDYDYLIGIVHVGLYLLVCLLLRLIAGLSFLPGSDAGSRRPEAMLETFTSLSQWWT